MANENQTTTETTTEPVVTQTITPPAETVTTAPQTQTQPITAPIEKAKETTDLGDKTNGPKAEMQLSDLSFPADVTLPDTFKQEYLAFAKSSGLSKEQVNSLISRDVKILGEAKTNYAQSSKAEYDRQISEWKNEAKTHFSDNYEPLISGLKASAEKAGKKGYELLVATGLSENKEVLEYLSGLQSEIPITKGAPKSSLSPAGEEMTLTKLFTKK